MIELLVVLKLGGILAIPLVAAAFLTSLGLWGDALVSPRLEPFSPWVLYPFQWFNGFQYLLRMAYLSFLRHGRRPGDPHFGFYQVGQLYDWSFRLWDEEDRPHGWMPSYYDIWISAANSVLFDSWLGEQNMTLFFRWGSFARYLFLWAYYLLLAVGRYLQQRVLRTETGLLWQLAFWRCWPFLWRRFSRPLWAVSQLLSRFLFALAGDFMVANFIRFCRLEWLFRVQWYQQDNVDSDDSPEEFHGRPLPLAFYRFLWYGNQRQQQVKSYSAPRLLYGFASFLALLLLTGLVLPWAALSAIFLGSFWLYDFIFQRQWSWFRRWVQGPTFWLQQTAFQLFSLAFYPLAFLSFYLWGAAVWMAVASLRRLTWALALLGFFVALWSLVPSDTAPFLAFGFGYIFLEFFEQLLPQVMPLTIHELPYDSLALQRKLGRQTWWQLRDWWQEEVFKLMGHSYHGHHWFGGIHTSILGYENPPWLPKKRKPSMWVAWWQRKENWWWWDRPIAQWAPKRLHTFASALCQFQYRLEHSASYSVKAMRDDLKVVYHLKQMILNRKQWTQLYHHSFVNAGLALLDYNYQKLAYRLLYCRDGYYWVRLCVHDPFYGFCLVLTLLIDWGFEWPFYRLLWLLRFWAVHLPLFRWSLSAAGAVGGGLLAVCGGALTLPASLPRPALPALPWPSFWRWTPTGQALLHWMGALRLGLHSFFGWILWYLSIIFDELLEYDLYGFLRSPEAPVILLQLLRLLPLDLWSSFKGFTLIERRSSLFRLALAAYVALQELWDRVFMPLQLPRFLDDHGLNVRSRFPVRSWVFGTWTSSNKKGGLLANFRWKLPPVYFFRETTLLQFQRREYPMALGYWKNLPILGFRAPHWDSLLEPVAPDLWIVDLSYLPFLLDDGYLLFLSFTPFLYFLTLFGVLTFFPGSSALLFDRHPNAPAATAAIFNRQWAWESCRFDQPLVAFESLFHRLPSPALMESHVAMDLPWTDRAFHYYDRLYSRYLDRQGWPSLLAPYLRGRSLSRSYRWQTEFLHSPRRLLVPFAKYLFEDRYDSLRGNYLDHGMSFLRFIAINFRRNPWVPLCHNQYEQYDYHTWLADASLELAELCTQATKQSRHFLEKADRWLFDKQLGSWVLYKDLGHFAVERTSSVKEWQEMAYEMDDKDHEGYLPWGTLWWLVLVPLTVPLQLYFYLESAWTADPIFPGTGSNELRRFLLYLHSFGGHFSMLYEQMEWRGWWYLPDNQRPDNPATDVEEMPIVQYHFRWGKREAASFYMVPMRWNHTSYWTIAPWGTSQPLGLLEEYVWVGRLRYLLILLLFGFLARYQLPWTPFALSYGRRWPSLMQHLKSYHRLFLWFWK